MKKKILLKISILLYLLTITSIVILQNYSTLKYRNYKEIKNNQSLNITLDKKIFQEKFNYNKNSITLNMTKTKCQNNTCEIFFIANSKIPYNHSCIISFLFDNYLIEKFNKKIILKPEDKKFKIILNNTPIFNTIKAYYTCKIK